MLFSLPTFISISSFLNQFRSWYFLDSFNSFLCLLFPYFLASTFLKFTNHLPSTSFSTSPFLYSRHVPLFMSFLHLISHFIHSRRTFFLRVSTLQLLSVFICLILLHFGISLRSKITRFIRGDYASFLGCRKWIGCYNNTE